MIDKLNQLINDYSEISEKMSDNAIINNINKYTSLAKEHRRLSPIVSQAKRYIKLLDESEENKKLLTAEIKN